METNVTQEEIKFDEKLTAYLRGELSTDEEKLFLEFLENNPDKKSDAIAIARLINGIKINEKSNDDEIINALKNTDNDFIYNVLGKEKPKKSRIIKFTKILVAASVAVLLFLGIDFFIKRSENQQLATKYASEIYLPDNFRGGEGNDVSNELKVLFTNVDNATNLNTTIEQLNTLWIKSLSEEFNEYINFSSQIGQYLVIANLKNNNRTDAKIVLKKIIETSEEGSALKTWAENILKEL